MTHHEEPAQNERAKATVRNKWSPNLIPTVKVHRNAKSDASVKELADDIKHHFDGSNPNILDPRRCLMYENIDEVTYLCCKVKQRPNERGVYWLESMVPGPRLAFIKADQRKGCIDILVSIDIVAIRMMRDGVVVAPLKA